MKNKKIISIVSIVLAVLIIFMSVGYAFFTESLTINGVASTIEYYGGEKLPTEPIKLDTNNNRYHIASGTYYRVDFDSETWNDDTYTLIYKKNLGMLLEEHNIDYSISFSNPTVLPYTDGTVTSEIIENGGGMLLDANARIDKTELQPGEAVTVTIRFHTNITWRHHTETAKATVSYMLQGKRHYFYYILTYTT